MFVNIIERCKRQFKVNLFQNITVLKPKTKIKVSTCTTKKIACSLL